MAISKKSIIDRAYRIVVGAGLDPHESAVVDNSFVFEDLFPLALREACVMMANEDAAGAESLRRTYTLTFVNGVADMPDTVLEEFLDRSYLYDTAAPENSEFNSYQTSLHAYHYPANPQLGHYAVQGATILYRAPYEDVATHDGDADLSVVGVPDVPLSMTAAMDISTELSEKIIEVLAGMARGSFAAPANGGASA